MEPPPESYELEPAEPHGSAALAQKSEEASARFKDTTKLANDRLDDIREDDTNSGREVVARLSWIACMLLSTAEDALRTKHALLKGKDQEAADRVDRLEQAYALAKTTCDEAVAARDELKAQLQAANTKAKRDNLAARQRAARDAAKVQDLSTQLETLAANAKITDTALASERVAEQASAAQREKNLNAAVVRLQRDLDAALAQVQEREAARARQQQQLAETTSSLLGAAGSCSPAAAAAAAAASPGASGGPRTASASGLGSTSGEWATLPDGSQVRRGATPPRARGAEPAEPPGIGAERMALELQVQEAATENSKLRARCSELKSQCERGVALIERLKGRLQTQEKERAQLSRRNAELGKRLVALGEERARAPTVSPAPASAGRGAGPVSSPARARRHSAGAAVSAGGCGMAGGASRRNSSSPVPSNAAAYRAPPLPGSASYERGGADGRAAVRAGRASLGKSGRARSPEIQIFEGPRTSLGSPPAAAGTRPEAAAAAAAAATTTTTRAVVAATAVAAPPVISAEASRELQEAKDVAAALLAEVEWLRRSLTQGEERAAAAEARAAAAEERGVAAEARAASAASASALAESRVSAAEAAAASASAASAAAERTLGASEERARAAAADGEARILGALEALEKLRAESGASLAEHAAARAQAEAQLGETRKALERAQAELGAARADASRAQAEARRLREDNERLAAEGVSKLTQAQQSSGGAVALMRAALIESQVCISRDLP